MTLKRKNLKKKIASLSALGAGALVAGVGTAEAGMVYSGPINYHVGFDSGGAPTPDFLSPYIGPNSAFFTFYAGGFDGAGATFASHNQYIVANACGCFKFALNQANEIKTFDVGAVWAPSFSAASVGGVGVRGWGSNFAPSGTTSTAPPVPLSTHAFAFPSSYTDKYSLFRFSDGTDFHYGWIHLSYSVAGLFGTNPAYSPDLLIQDYAFSDTANQEVYAGQGETPEPANFFSTGLGALVLGAAGLRSWRKTRRAA